MPLEADLQSDLSRTAVWFARHSRYRGSVKPAKEVLDSLAEMLNMKAVTGTNGNVPDAVALYDRLCSLQVCSGAVIGATAVLLFSKWQVALFLICLVGAIAHRLVVRR
ncbi:hypothetical protein ABBQ38_002641 [Trebouxia sp. C0009 RCD-2024]